MNKQKKLKLILSSFKEKQLVKFFQAFLDSIKSKFYKSIKQISFSCFQSTCQVENYLVNGYGKTSSEALISGINNLIDSLIEEEQYCEIMRQCLRKFNVSPYGLANNGTASKKQLLSTEKTLKTMGPESSLNSINSASVQKKVLTMSANLSSNSKESSSKGKSIKQQIFEYFNLQNLKVKNPNITQPFNSISPMAGNKKSSLTNEGANLCKSKEKYIIKQPQIIHAVSQTDKELEQVYKRIKEVQQKILQSQKQNKRLKQQVLNQKKQKEATIVSITQSITQPSSKNNYFTRPSIENQKLKKSTNLPNTQSNKKLSYMEMSLNDKENKKPFPIYSGMQSIHQVNNENSYGDLEKQYIVSKWCTKQLEKQKEAFGVKAKQNEQRRCLVDISNSHKGEHNQDKSHMKLKNSDYSDFSTFNNKEVEQKSSGSSAFQTLNSQLGNAIQNPILYSKNSYQQQTNSIIESSKKLRSLSVQNGLAERVNVYNTNIKNPVSIISSNSIMNSSQDNVNLLSQSIGQNIGQKKIKIPKLNLQILPNYHGKSNKSLNQSLMQNYQKKHQVIGAINQ